jgi:hypothetical protein
MDESKSLVNFGNLTKPANTLIEKISDAIGGIFRPYQIKRIAEAEADKIRAVSQIEITELERRAVTRLFVEEANKQNNIEAITTKALPELTEKAKPENVENDWITHFFDKCRLISDQEMQNLWAKVLAGQTNSPGSYSKRTVEILSNLEKSDAMLFTNLCSFGFYFLKSLIPLIYDTNHSIYNVHGINFKTICHLESLGLIHFDDLAGYRTVHLHKKGLVYYFGSELSIEFQNPEKNEFKLGKVLLTQAGQQLAQICGSQPIDGFVDYVKEKWKSFGYKIEQTAQ